MNKCVVILMGAFSVCAIAKPSASLSEVKNIHVCGKLLTAEVARSSADRERGLMGRTGIGKDKAMIFVFESEEPRSFWMKNVPFDIDIVFFDAKGNYVSHTTMKGTSVLQKDQNLPSYPSKGPAAYAVEVPSGFFKTLKTKSCRLSPLL